MNVPRDSCTEKRYEGYHVKNLLSYLGSAKRLLSFAFAQFHCFLLQPHYPHKPSIELVFSYSKDGRLLLHCTEAQTNLCLNLSANPEGCLRNAFHYR